MQANNSLDIVTLFNFRFASLLRRIHTRCYQIKRSCYKSRDIIDIEPSQINAPEKLNFTPVSTMLFGFV